MITKQERGYFESKLFRYLQFYHRTIRSRTEKLRLRIVKLTISRISHDGELKHIHHEPKCDNVSSHQLAERSIYKLYIQPDNNSMSNPVYTRKTISDTQDNLHSKVNQKRVFIHTL